MPHTYCHGDTCSIRSILRLEDTDIAIHFVLEEEGFQRRKKHRHVVYGLFIRFLCQRDVVQCYINMSKSLKVSEENTGIPFGVINAQMSYPEFANTLNEQNHTRVTNSIQNTFTMVNNHHQVRVRVWLVVNQQWYGTLEVEGSCEITASSTVDAVLDKMVDVAIDSFALRETNNKTQTSTTTDVGPTNVNNTFIIVGVIIILISMAAIIFFILKRANSGKKKEVKSCP